MVPEQTALSLIQLAVILYVQAPAAAQGVCTRSVSYTAPYDAYVIASKQTVHQRCNSWNNCWNVYGIEYTSQRVVRYRTLYRTERFCCVGYISNNGNCEKCPVGLYGQDCLEECQCRNNATCNHVFGECTCTPGWTGTYCQIECPEGFYGQYCLEECQCRNNATCNRESGDCACTTPGWTGTYCQNECPDGMYGQNCSMVCGCNENQDCDRQVGTCTCKAGKTGEVCGKGCDEGTFGPNCLNSCHCNRLQTCDPVTGNCSCIPGKTGANCTEDCSDWTWGLFCKEACNCSFNTTDHCDPVTGKCYCSSGWEGEFCAQEVTDGSALTAKTSIVIGLVVGGGLLFISLFVLLIIVCIRKKQTKTGSTENIVTNPALIQGELTYAEPDAPIYAVVNKVVNQKTKEDNGHVAPGSSQNDGFQNSDFRSAVNNNRNPMDKHNLLENNQLAEDKEEDHYVNQAFVADNLTDTYNKLDHSGRSAIVLAPDTDHGSYDHLADYSDSEQQMPDAATYDHMFQDDNDMPSSPMYNEVKVTTGGVDHNVCTSDLEQESTPNLEDSNAIYATYIYEGVED